MEFLKNILNLSKLPEKFFVGIAIISGLILFADNIILDSLRINSLKEDYGWITGLVFISSVIIVCINLTLWLVKIVRREIRFYRSRSIYTKSLKNLDTKEMIVLSPYILNNVRSLELSLDNATVTGLIAKRILVVNKSIAGGFFLNGTHSSISIHEKARSILKPSDFYKYKDELNKLNY